MTVKRIEVSSKKYGISGVILDYDFVTKLQFRYKDRDIVMAITRWMKEKDDEALGEKYIDSYIENLAPEGQRKLQLHYWYITRREEYIIAEGIVSGHHRLQDSIHIHTSVVSQVYVDESSEELIVMTRNSCYHCPLAYCRWEKQDEFPDLVPDYEKIKEKYQGKIEYPSIERGNVLLVLSNFDNYYFHSLFYIPENSTSDEPVEAMGYSHIGMFQDSYLIQAPGARIDIRYFPHYQNIEFYASDTDDRPLYLENIGDVVLYVTTSCGRIRLNPGDRKMICKENAEKDKTKLPNGDLYPAGVLEDEPKKETPEE